MSSQGITFDRSRAKSITPEDDPELFELAEEALFGEGGNGDFQYQGRWWTVAPDGQPGKYYEIWPQLR